MRLNNKLLVLFFGLSFILNMSVLSCNTKAEIPYVAPYAGGEDEEEEEEEEQDDEAPRTFKLLSLGDSYTIGQSVCISCRFPEQLKDSLIENFNSQDIFFFGNHRANGLDNYKFKICHSKR